MVQRSKSPRRRTAQVIPTTPTPPPPGGGWVAALKHRRLGIAMMLMVGLLVVYGQALGFEFISYDFKNYVLNNDLVRHGPSLAGIRWALTTIHGGYWMPLTWITHMLDFQFYGVHPWGHILGNILIHALNAVLLLLVLERMTGAFWPSAWVAAIFAFHPQRVESVVWVYERKDVLSAMFFILTLLAYERYVRGSFSLRRYGLLMLTFALGLLAKPSVVTLPFLLLLLDTWPLRRWPAPAADTPATARPTRLPILLLEKAPLIALAVLISAFTYYAQAVQDIVTDIPLTQRLANIPLHYMTYLGKTFWPFSLSVYFPLSMQFPPAGQVAAASGALLALTLGALLALRRHPYLAVGWCWFLGLLVPMIGLVQVFSQSIANRYTYLAQIGLLIGLAWGAAALAARFAVHRATLACCAGLLVLLLMIRTGDEVGNWRNDLTLWRHATEVNPKNDLAMANIGRSYQDRNDLQTALGYYRRALELNPNSANHHTSLGCALQQMGDQETALKEHLRAIELKPSDYHSYINAGGALAAMNRIDEAIEQFTQSLRLLQQKRPKGKDPLLYTNLANAYALKGDPGRADDYYQKALDADPDSFIVQFNCGVFAQRQRKYEMALEYLLKAAKLRPEDPTVPNQMAQVWIEKGDPARAANAYRAALDLARAEGNQPLADSIAEQLARLR